MSETLTLPIVVQFAGAIIVVALSAQAVMMLVGSWRRRIGEQRQRELSLALLREQVAAALAQRQTATRQSEAGWAGFRKFEIARKVVEGGDICSFYLAPHDRKALVPFSPGQYLTFQFRVPGQDRPVIRCYSLSDCFREDHYRISVKKVPSPRGKPEIPPGVVSNHLHQAVADGDIIDVKAPSGHFSLDPQAPGPVVLIGGGIGLTPVLSMLNGIVECGSTREVWFFYGVRHGGEHIMREHLNRLESEGDNVHMRVCYSDPRPEDTEGQDYDIGARVSVDLFKRLLPSNNYDFYMCGPPPMMASLTEALREWKVPKERVHFEAFGPASVKKAASPAKPDDVAATAASTSVVFDRAGKTFAWKQDAESLLAFAEANGVAMESGCRAGNCGSCLVAVKTGKVRYLTEPGAEVEPGSCLACISVPDGELTLDA